MLTLLLCGAATAVPSAMATSIAAPRRLVAGNALYPRLVRLEHSGTAENGRIVSSVVSFAGGTHAAILQSSDDGASFEQIGSINDPMAGSGECCGTMLELPAALGNLPAGTLLWAGSFGHDKGPGMAVRVWASRDDGRNWSYLSECAANRGRAGLWEPALALAAEGRLACYFGDESQNPVHSQVIAMTTSADGIHWSKRSTVVATGRSGERPGMPVVRRLPGGRYFMSYENCNVPHYFCGGYERFSPDGIHWKNPAAYGTAIRTADGHYFQHAQTVALLPGGPHGTRIVSIGQIYVDAKGHPAPGNGNMILVNDDLGAGPWHPEPAPLPVPRPYDNPCPNYSSALLATHGGHALLESATTFASNGSCRAYYASSPVS